MDPTRQAGIAGRPWYREPWPWLLMAGPAAVILAGAYTTLLAVRSDDGLVAEDYYKRALSINRVIRRGEAARALGLTATVWMAPARVRVLLRGGADPAALMLTLVHPTRAGQDREVALERVGHGLYEGALARVGSEPRRLLLEDDERRWRLAGSRAAGATAVLLEPGS